MSSINHHAVASLLYLGISGRGAYHGRSLPRSFGCALGLGNRLKTTIVTIAVIAVTSLMSAQAEPERALDLPLEMQRLIQIRDREVSAVDSKFLRAVKALRVEMREKQNDLAVRQLDAWLATHSDPILGEWILRQEGNSGKKFNFNKDGSWIRPEKEKQGPMKGKPMEGDWKRQGDRIIIWRAPGYPSDPDKPLAEIKIDIDRGELQWTPLQGKVKMVGKRPADLITPSSKTNSIFKVE